MQQAPLISIIDDDESVRVATACLLRSLGYRTHTFASADERQLAAAKDAGLKVVDIKRRPRNLFMFNMIL